MQKNYLIDQLRFQEVLIDFLYFGLKQVRAALFPGLFFLLLFCSQYASALGLYRYDFLFLGAVFIQIILLALRLETKDEAKVIFLFHIIGLVLELYKTSAMVGSWSYPEEGYLKIGNVPLYSGFMYAAVGSYIAQAWKIFRLELVNHPPYSSSIVLCVLIYLNFFTNHFIHDLRTFLFIAVFALYYKTTVYFTPRTRTYHMPLIVSFVLIAGFIWIGENIATFYGAWQYPDQIHAWHVVNTQKITSWSLLVIISFIIVAYLKHFKKQLQESRGA